MLLVILLQISAGRDRQYSLPVHLPRLRLADAQRTNRRTKDNRIIAVEHTAGQIVSEQTKNNKNKHTEGFPPTKVEPQQCEKQQ